MNVFTRTGICALLMVVCLLSAARAQLILNRQVTATSGGSGTANNGVRIQYTIGEPVITMITDGRTILTQGFHQPEELPPSNPLANAVKGYIIFPNPVATTLKVQIDLAASRNVQLSLINTAGQLMYTVQQTLGAGRNTITIPVNKFASGIYTLQVKVETEIFFDKVIIQ